jgi:predicted ATP-grasp superfamily ATP-dependent carboligase
MVDSEREPWRRLARVLIEWSGLRGLFGVDAIMRDGVPWLVEVNPRYTASVEVFERALAFSCFAGGRAFSESAVLPRPTRLRLVRRRNNEVRTAIGKAIYYAPKSLIFPARGPWHKTPPDFADIPRGGTRIRRGRPVLTIFGRDEAELRRKASKLDTLFGGECSHDAQRTIARRRG